MLLAVFSDIHANLQAFEAALAEAEARGAERYYFLGDIVGYGADPKPCLDLLRERFDGAVLGNHDLAVATGEGIRVLPRDGQEAARMHREQLSDDDLAYLAALPLTLVADGCTFVHASPEAPAQWLRLDSFRATKAQFDHFETDVCFIGHSHMPAVMSSKLGVMKVRRGPRFLINVGSVGQPRDHDPRLSFGLFDTEAFTYEHVRAHYKIEQAARSIVEAGLPKALGERLKMGR
jgi:diadenosine tetraphosphatase ApaH/serine/threonine PP2A family protein phosphatase